MLWLIFILYLPLFQPADTTPGRSESTAKIGVQNLPGRQESYSYKYVEEDENEEECAATDEIKVIRNEMSKNASLIRSFVHSTSAVGIIIKNSRSYSVYYFWLDNNGKGSFQGMIKPRGVTATLSYITHKFYIVKDQSDEYSK